MAEIKSTMEMVLARAAKMAAEAAPVVENEDLIRTGMRLAAGFLNDTTTDLAGTLSEQPGPDQMEIRMGMAQTLLRNIVLPRDEQLQESGKKALQGILALGGNGGDIKSICQELVQILEQYGQHKEQTTQQLEDAIRAQMEQQQQMAGNPDVQGGTNPQMHPQYQEELSKMLTSLNNQYNDAMNQRKEMILQRFTPTAG
ncbi:MAG: hypothetical protein ACN4GW_05500 [Desulforhopalus sp.]